MKKGGCNDKNMDTAYSRGVSKSLFCSSSLKDTCVMCVCLCHVEAVVRDRFSSLISSLYVVKKGGRRKCHHVMDSPIRGEHDGASCNSVLHCVCKLVVFVSTCNLFSQYLLYKSIFLLLLLCRAVALKVVSIQGRNLARACTQLSRLSNGTVVPFK